MKNKIFMRDKLLQAAKKAASKYPDNEPIRVGYFLGCIGAMANMEEAESDRLFELVTKGKEPAIEYPPHGQLSGDVDE